MSGSLNCIRRRGELVGRLDIVCNNTAAAERNVNDSLSGALKAIVTTSSAKRLHLQ